MNDHWLAFAEHKDDQLTRKILTDETQQIITRSSVRSAIKTSPNLRLNPPEGEDQLQDLTSDVFVDGRLHPDGSEETPPMSILIFDYLLLPMNETGERKDATISDHVHTLDDNQSSKEVQILL